MQQQIKDIEEERNSLLDSLDECQKSEAAIETEDNFKANVIKSLDENMQDSELNLISAREARNKELELIGQSNEDLKNALLALQQQYDESLGKILEQNSQIRELQEKIVDFEYLNQRNLRA